jgi:hypothetical protein
LPELAPRIPAKQDMGAPPPQRNEAAHLIDLLDEVEKMLTPPLIPSEMERAKAAALFIARQTRDARTANLAMQLMSALHESRGYEDVPGGYRMALARLRAALQHATS